MRGLLHVVCVGSERRSSLPDGVATKSRERDIRISESEHGACWDSGKTFYAERVWRAYLHNLSADRLLGVGLGG